MTRGTGSHGYRTITVAAHVPIRRCLGCGARRARSDLARFVAAEDGADRRLVRDSSGRMPGRGLYVCPVRACYEAALSRRAFARGARLRGQTLRIDDDLVHEFES